MGFLSSVPPYWTLYGVPNASPSTWDLMYGIKEHQRYVLFRNRNNMGESYAISTNIYRHIYVLGNLYVLDLKTIVNGNMFYRVYGDDEVNFRYIYYTHTYGWVMVWVDKTLPSNPGYYPIEYTNQETQKVEGDKFYVVEGIDNDANVESPTVITLTPRGRWIKDKGTETCPGVSNGQMCWCGFVNASGIFGRYMKVDTCKPLKVPSYPMDDVEKDEMLVGVATWKSASEPYIVIQYAPDKYGEYSFRGEGVSVDGNGHIRVDLTYNFEDGTSTVVSYVSDKHVDKIKLEETILLKYYQKPEASKLWVYLQFEGYKKSNFDVYIMIGQAAIWR